MSRRIVPIRELSAARDAARRMRAAWLVGLHERKAAPVDLIGAASQPGGKPLRAVRLTELLSVRHTPGERNLRLALLRRGLSVPSGILDKSLTVGWLLKGGTRPHHRLAAFVEAEQMTGLRERERTMTTFPFVSDDETLAEVWRGSW